MIDYETLQAQWAERCERLRVANNADRDVKFDGYADSGQIDDVVISGRESLAGEVAITDVPWNGPDEARTCPLSEALENLCYALQEQEHAGWQDNDGAYGTFVFDVPARTVILECHERYPAYSTSEHVFGGEE